MAAGNTARIVIKASTQGAEKKLKGLNKQLGGMKKAAIVGAAATAGLGLAAGAMAGKAFSMASSLDALQQKTQIVFGDQLGTVQKWADSTSAAMGLSSMEAQGLAANMGDLLVPMGFNREMAAKMATETIGLSGALAEWSGGTKSAAEVSDILSKAMLGEREQLKTLGISIMEQDVKNRLLAKGQEELTGTALQQARALATQELIFEKSADAQAKFAQGGGSLIRTQAELTASLKTARDSVLMALMPAFQQMAAFLSETVIPKIKEFIPVLQENIPKAIAALGKAFNASKPFLKVFLSGIMTIKDGVMLLVGVWQDAGPKMKLIIAGVGLALAVAFGPVSIGFVAIVGLIALIGTMRDKWREIVNAILGFVETLAQGVANVIHSIVTNIHQRLINGVIEMINMFIGTVGPLLSWATKGKVQLEELETVNLPKLEVKIPRIQKAAEEMSEKAEEGIAIVHELGEEMNSTFKGMVEVVQETATEATASAKHMAKLQADAMLAGNMDFLEFLEKNEQAIDIETAKMTDTIKKRFGSEMVNEIEIMDSVVKSMWETHMAGIEAATKKEEELARARNAKLAAQGRMNTTLLSAMYKSWAAGPQTEAFNPNMQFGKNLQLQSMATGGIVQGPRGAPVPIIAHGGEQVIPAGKAGGVTININGLVAGDPIQVGRQIADIINKSARANRGLIKSEAVAS